MVESPVVWCVVAVAMGQESRTQWPKTLSATRQQLERLAAPRAKLIGETIGCCYDKIYVYIYMSHGAHLEHVASSPRPRELAPDIA